MESVMNFLADNYVWFFVAAGVLCFALIGFIIESRKKQKSEFKGESIEENTPVSETTTSTNNNGTVVEPISETTTETIAEPTVIEQNTETIEPIQNNNIEETMEINDIPISDNKPTSIEFYSGPIEMKTPVVEANPNSVEDTENIEQKNDDTISYTQVITDNTVNEPELIADEKKEETNNYDTF